MSETPANTMPAQVELDALTIRILADVHNRHVSAYRDDTITIPDDVPPPHGEDYRTRVITLLYYSWVMRPAEGFGALLLTSVGEYYWRRTNPEAYRSPVSYRNDDGARSPERRAVR